MAFIQEFNSASAARSSFLDKEIPRLLSRGSLSTFRVQNTAILSPLRRMPPEVLAEIFSRPGRLRKLDMAHSPWVTSAAVDKPSPSRNFRCGRCYALHGAGRAYIHYPWSRCTSNEYEHLKSISGELTRYTLDAPWDMPWPNAAKAVDLLLLCLFVSHADILSYLRAPAVQEIVFYLDADEGPHLLPHLEGFVVRSGCYFRRLYLQGTPAVAKAGEILRQNTSVTQLAIIISITPHQTPVNLLMSHLTVLEGTRLAPQLFSIQLWCQGASDLDLELYLQMLQSRWKTKDCALERAALITESDRNRTLRREMG
ncbi:hypothetical protein B0H17DRAFT_1179078 [Mycena rosella]|uniref:F-box domain-containing protein n=1 Tax=Mycena rosella TaxID=1033263 RepID=A0AAD7DK02_MYCRO|nr:hypothetical protein B0H17DRAFT_1179078 [Mycena rosella]